MSLSLGIASERTHSNVLLVWTITAKSNLQMSPFKMSLFRLLRLPDLWKPPKMQHIEIYEMCQRVLMDVDHAVCLEFLTVSIPKPHLIMTFMCLMCRETREALNHYFKTDISRWYFPTRGAVQTALFLSRRRCGTFPVELP